MTRPLPPFTHATKQDTVRGRSGLAEQYADPALWPPTPRTMRHVLSNLRFSALDEDSAAATVTWTGYRYEGEGLSVANPMAVGDYVDEYRRDTDGHWRIHRRRIVIAFLNRELLSVAEEATRGNR